MQNLENKVKDNVVIVLHVCLDNCALCSCFRCNLKAILEAVPPLDFFLNHALNCGP